MNFFLSIIFATLFIYSSTAQAIAFIVNSKCPLNELTLEQVNDFYFKRSKHWPDGTPVRFFDQSDASPERKKFLQIYLNKSPQELEEFWIGQKLYSGYSAPSQVDNDKLMEALVMRFPGAIGYINKNSAVKEGVKKIAIKKSIINDK